MRAVVRAGLAAVAYFACARLGYAFTVPHGIVALWPPSGLMLALLVVSDRRDWPALVAGGFMGGLFSDLLSGYSLGFGLAAAVANCSESILAAWFVTWRLGSPVTLVSLRSVMEFTAGSALLANSLTAFLGAILLHRGFGTPLWRGWFAWWVGDGLGMLIVAPVLVAWADSAGRLKKFRAIDLFEAAALLSILAATAQFALGPNHDWLLRPGPYAIFPLLFWAALRFGLVGAATATLIVALVATWNAALGVGPFAYTSPASTAVQLYAYLAVASISSLIPAAVLEERRAAGERLRESEERYRTVVDAATDAIITIDQDSRIEFVNAAAERVFGYAPQELAGHPLTMLLPADPRDSRRSGLARLLATSHRDTESQAVALTGLARDGREIPLEASFGEVVSGERRVFTGIFRDVSERRAAQSALHAAEERMRFAMEAAQVGVWDVDFATGGARWSETLERLHGMAAGTFGGTFQAFLDRIHPDDVEAVHAAIDKATREHSDSNILYRTQRPDGSVHWISGVGRTFYDAEGTPVRAAGVGFDVTERRSLEEQYRQSQKMDAIGQLAGGVAHDFNNLLTVILAESDLALYDDSSAAPPRESLVAIRRSAESAALLTRQLLTFSRRQLVEPDELNLNDVVAAVEKMLRRLIGEHVRITLNLAHGLHRTFADRGQLEQVLINLAVNARDAMPAGGTLAIETGNVHLDEAYARGHVGVVPGDYVMLAVSDTGSGMGDDVKAHLFEPFFTTKALGKGTGLGLATCFGIVRHFGGHIDVFSQAGEGTTMRVYLPKVEVTPAPAEGTIASPALGGRESILVVEDDVDVRRVSARLLKALGYTVHEALDGVDAIDFLGRNGSRVDLMITDVVMPRMGGRELAQHVSQRWPAIRILFCSGYSDDVILQTRLLEGEVTLLQKPFTGAALREKVRALLDAPARR